MIKNVIFDVGNVLVEFRWRKLMEELGAPTNVQSLFEKNVFGSHWWGELDLGCLEESDVVAHLRRESEPYQKEFDAIWENRSRLVEPYNYTVPWIKHLKQQGLCVYLLSNYPREMFTLHTECGCFPFLDDVDGKVVSGFVRMVKPNADIYLHLIEKYHLNASECVFLDDRKENIQTAVNIGMKGIVFEKYDLAAAMLEEYIKKSKA